MRKQQKIWQEEYEKSASIPSLAQDEPSSAVVQFVDFLKDKKIELSGKVIDIGCGKGRNTIFLAKQGLRVYAVDYIESALKEVEQKALLGNVKDKVHIQQMEIDKPWPFGDNFFDLAVDCFSSIDIETREGREIYRSEMLRTLKPGGFAMVAVVSAEDELEKTFPVGPEKNSTIWPTGKFQKNYDRKELFDFYKDFEIVELKEIKKKAFKLGKEYQATNWWVVLKKPL